MSQLGEARTDRHEPSLMDMSSTMPRSISTTVCTTPPASKQRAAPWVRLTSPDATAASWSARSRGRRSELVSRSPSADTTMACATPGTRSAKFETSQPNRLGWVCGAVTPPPCCTPSGGVPSVLYGPDPWARSSVFLVVLAARGGGGVLPGGTRLGAGTSRVPAEPDLAALPNSLLVTGEPTADALGAARRGGRRGQHRRSCTARNEASARASFRQPGGRQLVRTLGGRAAGGPPALV